MSDDELLQLAEAGRLENIPEGERGPDMPRQYGRIGGFRSAFDADEIALMNAIMGPNLRRYGYEVEISPARMSAGSATASGTIDAPDPVDIVGFTATPLREPTPVELPLDPLSPVALLDNRGFFADGWVRWQASITGRALRAVTTLSLELWVPPEEGAFALTLRMAGTADITQSAPRDLASVLRCAVSLAPSQEFSIELLASHEDRLSDSDQRSASYILSRISFF